MLQEATLHTLPQHGKNPMTEKERGMLLSDFVSAKNLIAVLLRTKTNYLRRLPWLMAGLAHHQEACARHCAVMIKDQWQANPCKDAHHRLTVQYMSRPGFVSDIEKLANGETRSRLSTWTQETIASLRFIPVVETTIEEKHARLTRAKRMHDIKATRTSLSNRLPWLERSCLKEHVSMPQLLHHFHQARHIQRLPALLGVEMHPDLLDADGVTPLKMSSGELARRISRITYHCDISSLFVSQAVAGREHVKSKNTLDRIAAKLVAKVRGCSQVKSLEDVMNNIMSAHFLATHQPYSLYSAPRSCMELESLDVVLEEPLVKKARQRLNNDELAPEIENAEAQSHGELDDLVFFQVEVTQPSRKKQVSVLILARQEASSTPNPGQPRP